MTSVLWFGILGDMVTEIGWHTRRSYSPTEAKAYRLDLKARKQYAKGAQALNGVVEYLRWRCEVDDDYHSACAAFDLVYRLRRELWDASVKARS